MRFRTDFSIQRALPIVFVDNFSLKNEIQVRTNETNEKMFRFLLVLEPRKCFLEILRPFLLDRSETKTNFRTTNRKVPKPTVKSRINCSSVGFSIFSSCAIFIWRKTRNFYSFRGFLRSTNFDHFVFRQLNEFLFAATEHIHPDRQQTFYTGNAQRSELFFVQTTFFTFLFSARNRQRGVFAQGFHHAAIRRWCSITVCCTAARHDHTRIVDFVLCYEIQFFTFKILNKIRQETFYERNSLEKIQSKDVFIYTTIRQLNVSVRDRCATNETLCTAELPNTLRLFTHYYTVPVSLIVK